MWRNFYARLAVLMFAICAFHVAFAQDVRSNYMPGTNFAKFHTYKWVAIEGGAHPNQIVDAQIKQAVDMQMQAKGFTKTDSESADLYVGYQVAVDQERQWNGFGMGGGMRWGGMAQATSSTITNGSLVLDMYDSQAKQLVWTGTATKTLSSTGNQEKDQKALDKAMQKLMKAFPPKL